MRRVHPPQLVEVLNADVWRLGQLGAWRRDSDGWNAYVRYSVGTGMQHLGWTTANQVRPPTVRNEPRQAL